MFLSPLNASCKAEGKTCGEEKWRSVVRLHSLNMKPSQSVQLLFLCSSQNMATSPFSEPQKLSPTLTIKLLFVMRITCGLFSERDIMMSIKTKKVGTFVHISVGLIMLKQTDGRSVSRGGGGHTEVGHI